MAGRKPKPTAIKRLEGNRGRRPLPESEPEYDLPMVDAKPPKFLNRSAKRFWRQYLPSMVRAGVVTEMDLPLFAQMAQAWGEYAEIEREIKTMKPVLPTTKGSWKANPMFRVRDKAQETFQKIAVEFGLSPSSRTRIVANPMKKVDPMAKLLRRKQNRAV